MVRASAVSVLPAVLVKGHDEALVLDAGHAGVVPVLAGEHLLLAVLGLLPDVGELRPVEPQQPATSSLSLSAPRSENIQSLSN